MIDKAAFKIALETQDRIYAKAAPLIRVVSGLAEGADRIAVTAAPADWRLEAILPMPRAEYARDFSVPRRQANPIPSSSACWRAPPR